MLGTIIGAGITLKVADEVLIKPLKKKAKKSDKESFEELMRM